MNCDLWPINMAESLLVGRNFVSDICKLKTLKKPENLKFLSAKTLVLCFYHRWYEHTDGAPPERLDPLGTAFQGHSRSSKVTWIYMLPFEFCNGVWVQKPG